MTRIHDSTDVLDAFDDEEVWNLIWGSGFTQYSWYREIRVDANARTMTVDIDNGDDGIETAKLTVGALRRAVNDLVRDENVYSFRFADNWLDPDFDADMADQVVQYAVLGDIIFG
jgi:hypothetical protein